MPVYVEQSWTCAGGGVRVPHTESLEKERRHRYMLETIRFALCKKERVRVPPRSRINTADGILPTLPEWKSGTFIRIVNIAACSTRSGTEQVFLADADNLGRWCPAPAAVLQPGPIRTAVLARQSSRAGQPSNLYCYPSL